MAEEPEGSIFAYKCKECKSDNRSLKECRRIKGHTQVIWTSHEYVPTKKGTGPGSNHFNRFGTGTCVPNCGACDTDAKILENGGNEVVRELPARTLLFKASEEKQCALGAAVLKMDPEAPTFPHEFDISWLVIDDASAADDDTGGGSHQASEEKPTRDKEAAKEGEDAYQRRLSRRRERRDKVGALPNGKDEICIDDDVDDNDEEDDFVMRVSSYAMLMFVRERLRKENEERLARGEAEVKFPSFVLDYIDVREYLTLHAVNAAPNKLIKAEDFDLVKYIDFDPKGKLDLKYSESKYYPGPDLVPLATVCHWRFRDLDDIANRLNKLCGAIKTAVRHPSFTFHNDIKEVSRASPDTSGLRFMSFESYRASADLLDAVEFGKRLAEDGGKCALFKMFNTEEAMLVAGGNNKAGLCGTGVFGRGETCNYMGNDSHLMGTTPTTMRTRTSHEQDRKVQGTDGGQYCRANTRRACMKHNEIIGKWLVGAYS
jgi:hypothetical protein